MSGYVGTAGLRDMADVSNFRLNGLEKKGKEKKESRKNEKVEKKIHRKKRKLN